MTAFDFHSSYHSLASTEETASHAADKALFCASTFRLAEMVWNQHTEWLIGPISAFTEPSASPLLISLTLLQSSRSLHVSFKTSFKTDVEGGNGFEVTLGLVLWMGGITRYYFGPNILGGWGDVQAICLLRLEYHIPLLQSFS